LPTLPKSLSGKNAARLAALAPLAALLFFAGCDRKSQPEAGVWASVNGKEIKREEVDKYYRTRVNPEGQEPSQEEALTLKLRVLDELVNNEILLQRAKKLNLEASDGEVEDKFTEMKSPFTEDEFQRKLKEGGLTVDDLKRDLRRELSIQKLINREVVAKISITDQDVSDFYNTYRQQFNLTEAQLRIARIVVTPHREEQVHNRKNDDAANEADARRKVQMLSEKIAAGVDFSALAMDYSEDPNSSATGGDLGYIQESALNKSDPALKKLILGMKVGQVNGPVTSKEGYVFLKLIAREPAGQRNLSDPPVQQTIRETLRTRKEQLLRAAYQANARDESRVTNYLAQQVLEAAGKLPGAAKSNAPAK